ncbi:MAG: 1-acyl-sn-glycerol-3-phosphate acyltransferase [Tidjanibacter sp.]|nr:1-acyl-sn-glycerol-3-phosphate acyltransferase [Tidjanibacter sp.]MBR4037814.1 1-acyl-sn-glycerol-3-phosphate acyltransferase [Tidjanibacter sp.]
MAKKTKKIQDYDRAYALLRHYVDFALRLSYRGIEYRGVESLPTDGAIIFAPNHTNALMDALVILAMDRRPKVFVARADIFRNPMLAKIFRFLKIMPIMRMRDGIDEVRKNNKTIEKSVDVLRDKVPFCIFPEGTHQAKYSLQMLSKGVFRIALQAQELMPDVPLYIVPVGMRYGNFFRFRSTVRVQMGTPINVGEYIAEHPDQQPAERMNALRTLLTERIKESIFYIPNDEDYDATYEICAAVAKPLEKELEGKRGGKRISSLDAHFEANNLTVSRLQEMKEAEPERAAELLALGNEAHKLRNKHRVSMSSVSVKYPFWSRLLKALFLVATMGYWIPVSLLTLPINALCAFAFTLIKDMAFRNSVRFVVNLVLWPLLMIVYGVLLLVFLPWQWALLAIVALLPAPVVAHEVYRLWRLIGSDVRFLGQKRLRNIYKEIREKMLNK